MIKINDKYKNIIEWILSILIALILALITKYYIGTPTVVKMTSMYPTLVENDRLILNRLDRTFNTKPERGDIVTFEAPSSNSYTQSLDFNSSSIIAKFDDEPNNIIGKFFYNVLETNKKSYIKRVIGLPGDTIEIRNGLVFINGEIFVETYLQIGITTDTSNSHYSKLTVPEGCVYLMGDNRPYSTDSRDFGCVPIDKLEGTLWIRFWPFDKYGEV